jgi:Domain of unknown function (DUF5619)
VKKEDIFMNACERPTAEMFDKAIHLHIGGETLTHEEAKRAAYEHAKAFSTEPMLLSWFDRQTGSCFPSEEECCSRDRPRWVTYARSRGGDLVIDINNGAYIFIFRGKEGLS